MATTEGGYGGTISQWGNINTPYGYVFADALQGKIFVIAGGKMQEISKQGMKKEFFNILDRDLNNDGYVDKPFSGTGVLMGWDPDNERVLITKLDSVDSKTYSFSFLSGVWVSEHSYKPNVYFTLDKYMYSVNEDIVYRHGTGDYGNFYGTVFPMKLEYVHNENAAQDKVFDNMIFATKTKDGNVVKPLDTWDTVSLKTDLSATGQYVIKPKGTFPAPYTQGEAWASYVKNKYFLAIPGNAVVDEYLDITDPSNIDQGKLYKPRIKGDVLEVSLEYLNSDNYKFMVNFIACTTRINAR